MGDDPPRKLRRRLWTEPATLGYVPFGDVRRAHDGTEYLPGVLDPETLDVIGPYLDLGIDAEVPNPYWPKEFYSFSFVVGPSESDFIPPVGEQLRLLVDSCHLHSDDVCLHTLEGRCLAVATVSSSTGHSADEIRQVREAESLVVLNMRSPEVHYRRPQSGKGPSEPWTHISVGAAPRVEIVDRPWPGDPDYDEFLESHVWPARAKRWPAERDLLRNLVTGTPMQQHDAYYVLIARAHRFRELHPAASSDLIDLCREQIELARRLTPKLTARLRRQGRSGDKMRHQGFWRLVLALESEGRYEEALRVFDEATGLGFRDLESIRTRLSRKVGNS